MRKLWMALLVGFFLVGCSDDAEVNQWELCDEEPTCPEGMIEYGGGSSCPEGLCEEVSECGNTIYCEQLEECDAVPSCPDFTVEVASQSDCIQGAESCFSRTMCNFTIWCSEEPDCLSLDCPEGATEVDSQADCPQDDVDCYELPHPVCDWQIWCWEEAEPVCDEERTYFDECPAEFCDGPPETCDPCFDEGDYFEDQCGCGCEIREPVYCRVSDATGEGACEMEVGVVFDGDSCITISGCHCDGPDCERFESLEECQRVTGDCDGECGEPDGPICSMTYYPPDHPEGPEDCPDGSIFTVDDCEPKCVELDSCEVVD